jgi:hypothetical protein
MIIGHAREIDWDDIKVAFPSFLTIVLMPLTYSIAYGVLTGILANITLWLLLGVMDLILAAFKREREGRSVGQVWRDMWQCWFDAFEDFWPGLKAEWKHAFHNRVVQNPKGAAAAAKSEEEEEQVARIASSNGNFDYLAVNRPSYDHIKPASFTRRRPGSVTGRSGSATGSITGHLPPVNDTETGNK